MNDEPKSKTRVYEHAEGGLYVKVDEDTTNKVKMEDGSWHMAVHYRPVHFINNRLYFRNRTKYTTTEARWAERFKEIERT
jgi:hypothetical protein